MKLIFEKSVPGRRCDILGKCDVDYAPLPEGFARQTPPPCRRSARWIFPATTRP